MLMLSVGLAAFAVPLSAQTAVSPLATPEAVACAPRLATDESAPAGLVLGTPDVPLRELFGRGDAVLLNVGWADEVSVGTRFFTRRHEAPSDPEARIPGIGLLRTSGWLRVVEADEHSALAVVERTCTEVRRGDQLAPLRQWPAAVSIAPVGTFDYDDPATVLFGPEGRSMLGPGQFLVIDEGADRQIVPGQRLTIFRASPRTPQDPVTRLGEAVAVLVDSTSATVQVIQAREPIRRGDLVAIHR